MKNEATRESVSDTLLADYQLRSVFAKVLGVTDRTISNYENEPDGLPHAYIGGKDYVYVPGAKEWLARRVRQNNPRRGSRRAA